MALLTVERSLTLCARITGCLIGGAIGDALGAPVEFAKLEQIRSTYGPEGIQDFDFAYGKLGAITDDTQMTLYTAEGLIQWRLGIWRHGEVDRVRSLAAAYRRWLDTQTHPEVPPGASWLSAHPDLRQRRAPGLTCLGELQEQARLGSARFAHNDSKGCGGVMRIAPLGLVLDDPYDAACDAARLTHGHELGWASAGAFATIIARLRLGDCLRRAVAVGRQRVVSHPKLTRILDSAVSFSTCEIASEQAIRELGEGWVAEEALAIAVYCALRTDAFSDALCLAANHDGDSDSTASMTGQLLGVRFGQDTIPSAWRAKLEFEPVITQVANDLYDVFMASDDPLVLGPLGVQIRADLANRYPAQ